MALNIIWHVIFCLKKHIATPIQGKKITSNAEQHLPFQVGSKKSPEEMCGKQTLGSFQKGQRDDMNSNHDDLEN